MSCLPTRSPINAQSLATLNRILCVLVLPACLAGQEGPDVVYELDPLPVVGTRIRGIDLENTIPSIILDTETLEATGFSRIDDVLRSLPIMNGWSSSGVDESTLPIQGLSTVSMRGIYSGQLVLVNGLRIAPFGGSGVFTRPYDLFAIPSSAIEGVEILADGASAIYGADAISGVMNFRTIRNFRGARNLLDKNPPFFAKSVMGAHYLHPSEKRFWYLRLERKF